MIGEVEAKLAQVFFVRYTSWTTVRPVWAKNSSKRVSLHNDVHVPVGGVNDVH